MQHLFLLLAFTASTSLFFLNGCRETKKAPQRKVLDYGKGHLNWRQISKRKVISVNHGNAEEEIYADPEAYEVSKGDKNPPYPEGASLAMLLYKNGEKKPMAYLMKKMDGEYDPDNNNWRYSIVRISDWTIEKDGRLDECIDCHRKRTERRGRDFVPLMKKDGL